MALTKSEQREVQKVVNHGRTSPAYAAATLAPLLRSCRKASLGEIYPLIDQFNLRGYMEVVNGCWVAKELQAA